MFDDEQHQTCAPAALQLLLLTAHTNSWLSLRPFQVLHSKVVGHFRSHMTTSSSVCMKILLFQMTNESRQTQLKASHCSSLLVLFFEERWPTALFPRLHLDAPIADPALPDDGASSAHRHHPLREHPRIPCCQAEHPQVRTCEGGWGWGGYFLIFIWNRQADYTVC